MIHKNDEICETLLNPNRYQLSILYDEYLNETSPMNSDRLGYSATLKLIKQYVYGVTYHDITRAVRYFSPTYEVSFDNYIEILQIFLKEKRNYDKAAYKSIRNVLLKDKNGAQDILNSLREKAIDKTVFDKLQVVKSLDKYLNQKLSDGSHFSFDQFFLYSKKTPPKGIKPFDEKRPNFETIKITVHILDLFNADSCSKFIIHSKAPLRVGYAIECSIGDSCMFSRVSFQKYDKDEIYYHIDDILCLEQKIEIVPNMRSTPRSDCERDEIAQMYFTKLHDYPLLLNLYCVLLSDQLPPTKMYIGYLKVPIIPILFAAKHEILISANFIPLVTIEGVKPITVTMSLLSHDDPIVKYSSPIDGLESGRDIGCIGNNWGVSSLYKAAVGMTTKISRSREVQIAAPDDQNTMQLLCQFVNSNTDFDTDDFVEMLIQDARKLGPEMEVVRSPSVLYYSPTRLSQLERCIFLCKEINSHLMNSIENKNINLNDANNSANCQKFNRAYVCCGSIDFTRYYCVVSIRNAPKITSNNIAPEEIRYSNLIPGQVYPLSLITYQIRADFDPKDIISQIRLKNMVDIKQNNKILHVWCLSEVYNDIVPNSFTIGSIFNEMNIWINIQPNKSLLRLSWDISNEKLWKPVNTNKAPSSCNTLLDDASKTSLTASTTNVQQNVSNYTVFPYIYSQRKVVFNESYDKDEYELNFEIVLNKYKSEERTSFKYDLEVLHNVLLKYEEKLFSDPENEFEKVRNEYQGCYLFIRKIEAKHYLDPEDLLDDIVQNHGIRNFNIFDILISFKPLPLENCKIDIIIVYVLMNSEDEDSY